MMNHKKRLFILLLAAILVASLSGCGQTAAAPSAGGGTGSQAASSLSATQTATTNLSKEDSDSSWDNTATQMTLSGTAVEVSGNGASVAGTTVTISKAGTYVVSGTLDNGQILVDANKEDLVRIVLNGAQITCSNSAAIYSKQADKTVVILADGTTNRLTDGAAYQLDPGADEPDAALFSKDDLSITGTGSLTVQGNYKNGIGSKDDLLIVQGSITVNAVNDGIRGRDSITVADGVLLLEAGGDGLQSNNDTDPEKGWIVLSGGTVQITAGNDAVQAETTMLVEGGDYTIQTGGGSAAAPAHTEQGGFGGHGGGMRPTTLPDGTMPEGMPPTPPDGAAPSMPDTAASGSTTPPVQPIATNTTASSTPTTVSTDATTTTSDSYKGLKAGGTLTITGGSFTIDAQDDALHTNGDMTFSGGAFTIATGDDAFHADGTLTITGGTADISTCYEGLEGAEVRMSGGDISLVANDDGVNAAGGSDGDTSADSFRTGGSSAVTISGGTLRVDAQGDGLDANGSLYLEGGVVLVSGPTNTGNGALDYDKDCVISGGVLMAAGSAGMAQAPSGSSTQPAIMVYFTESQAAGTLVNLSDEEGNSILTVAPAKAFQTVVLSAPGLQQGKTYVLSTGGNADGIENGYSEGAYTDGQKITTVTVSEMITSISSDGSAVSAQGMMGGRGNKPGRDLQAGATQPPADTASSTATATT